MIYEILRVNKFPRDLGITLVASSLFFTYFRLAHDANPMPWACLFSTILYLVLVASQPRSSLFEAGLPIRARHIFCARMVTILTLKWTLILIFVAAVLSARTTYGARAAIFLFQAGAITTLAYIGLNSIGAEEVTPPRLWRRTIYAAVFVSILGLVVQALSLPISWLQIACVLAICGLGSAVLFLRTWRSFPESFQFSPKEPVKEKSQRRGLALPSFAWGPALSAVYDLKIVGWILLVLAWAAMGNVFILCLWTLGVFAQIRTRLTLKHRWIFGLPISRHRLFAMSALAPLAAIPLSALIQLHFSPQPATVIIFEAAAGAGASLLFFAAFQVANFIPHAGPWRKVSLTLAAFIPGGWLVWHWFNPMSHARRFQTLPFELWFASIPPARLPLVLIAAASILLALYWLAYLGFRRMEIPPRRLTSTRAG